MPRQATFATELKAWRKRTRLTQAKAAEFLDVPLRSYQAWEQGRQEPDQKGPIRRLIGAKGPKQ
jgi:DNA-binding transcriptional regulator YiaG